MVACIDLTTTKTSLLWAVLSAVARAAGEGAPTAQVVIDADAANTVVKALAHLGYQVLRESVDMDRLATCLTISSVAGFDG